MPRSNKRDDILNAALKLIVKHDLDHTSMDMIAKEAKVGMGTIYNYFPSKETLINELYRTLIVQLLKATLHDFSPEMPLREQFFTIVRSKFHFSLENVDAAQFIELYGYSPILTAETQAVAWQVWQIPTQIMEQGRQQQIIKDLPTQMLILLTSTPIFSLVMAHYQGRIRLDDAAIEAAITACWDAIKR